MSFSVGPVAVAAPGAVVIPQIATGPTQIKAAIISNATPFLLAVTVGTATQNVQPFTADIVVFEGHVTKIGAQASLVPGGLTGTGYVTVEALEPGDPTAGAYPSPLISALQTGIIAGTVTANLAPGQFIGVTGGTAIAGTPTGLPSLATRNVSASAAATGSVTCTTPDGTSSTTVIPAPTGGLAVELHSLVMAGSILAVNGADTHKYVVQLVDSVSAAVIALLDFDRGPTAGDKQNLNVDLQGVLLPAGHGVTLQAQAGSGVGPVSILGTLNTLTFTER